MRQIRQIQGGFLRQCPLARLVHNHPSGDPTPSRADIEMTQKVKDALEAVGLILHDHLIIGRGRHMSFKQERLI
jgi:DNA repair protein RadC